MPVTYSSYLRLEDLLSLQEPRSDGLEHDETLFIIVHQVYELWFKEVLHELDYLKRLLQDNRTPPALHTLKRILTILKVLVSQLDILETMTPLDFLSFRDRLESGSGFQSAQFRELEFTLGLKDPAAMARLPENSEEVRRLETRYNEPTVWDEFLRYLTRHDYAVPEDQLGRDVRLPVATSGGVQVILIDIYRNNPMIGQVCERLVDLDEGIQEWRYRHVKMVERTIGTKLGTGGSSGAEYLRSTLFRPAFPDLWVIRSEL